MSTSPRAIYLLKLSGDGDSIVINRTVKVIEDGEGFLVVVTDRDYVDDPSGQTQTIVFRRSYDSTDNATAAAQRQVELSLARLSP